ncbi:hypothetical protein PilKf_00206 [Pillotina sp. SPG140]
MKANVHVQAIPSTVLAEAQTHVEALKILLDPYMLALTAIERRELLKMGEKTIAFVEKAYDFARQNLQFVPSYLDIDAFGADFADAHSLWTIANSVRQVQEAIDDTEMVAGSEAYQAALQFYNAIKLLASQDVPGAKAIYEELRTRFPRRSRRSGDSEKV